MNHQETKYIITNTNSKLIHPQLLNLNSCENVWVPLQEFNIHTLKYASFYLYKYLNKNKQHKEIFFP